jgi:O-antigen/teichoic acid export membrane protein
MGYKKDVIKGFSWLGAFRLITRGLSFIRTAIIARLLTPSQVGVFAIATIVLSFMEILTETGINIFLIQKKDDIDRYISTAWVTSILRGIIISLIIFLAAPFVTNFYSLQESLFIFQLIAVVPFIRGFINPSVVKFLKDLSFHKEFTYRTGIFLVETAATLLLLLRDPSPVNLAWGLIFGAVFEVMLSFYMASPVPKFVFEGEKLREVIIRGKWLTFTGIFNYLYHNGDDLVVGKLLGTASLGLYGMAYKISLLPITEGSDVIGKVMFPVLSKMTHDLPRLKKAYMKSVLLISALVIPMGLLFFFFPATIISIILGDRWLGATDALQVLALFGVVRAISISIIAPLYALEKQEYVTVITLVSLIGMGVTILPFVTRLGIVGAGYSALFGTLLSLPVIFYYVRKVFR